MESFENISVNIVSMDHEHWFTEWIIIHLQQHYILAYHDTYETVVL